MCDTQGTFPNLEGFWDISRNLSKSPPLRTRHFYWLHYGVKAPPNGKQTFVETSVCLADSVQYLSPYIQKGAHNGMSLCIHLSPLNFLYNKQHQNHPILLQYPPLMVPCTPKKSCHQIPSNVRIAPDCCNFKQLPPTMISITLQIWQNRTTGSIHLSIGIKKQHTLSSYFPHLPRS